MCQFQCTCKTKEKSNKARPCAYMHLRSRRIYRNVCYGMSVTMLSNTCIYICKTLVAADFSAGWHPSKCRWWLHEDGRQHLVEASAVEQCRCISPEKRSSKNTSESLHSFPAKEGHRRAGKGGALKLQQLIHVHEKSCKTLVAADFSAGWHPSKCRWWLHEDGRQHLVEASAVEQCRCISPEKRSSKNTSESLHSFHL